MKRDYSHRRYLKVVVVLILFGIWRFLPLFTQKEPYRLEDVDISQVKIGDRVTLDVEYCCGIASYKLAI